MVKAALVGLDIEAGSRVVAALDKVGLSMKVALWITTEEYEDGRLILASPELDRMDLLDAYERIARILKDDFANDRPSLLILKMSNPFIKHLRQLFPAPKSIVGLRLGNQTIGDRFIYDAYLYRV